MFEQCAGKTVLFITTKNIDYIRNSQEIALLKEKAAAVTLLYSDKKSYPERILELYAKLLAASLKRYDVIFVGFAPQLIVPVFFWKMKKSYVMIDFFISIYDTLVNDRKKVKANTLPAKWMHWLDSSTIKKSQHVIADTKAHGAYFVNEFGATPAHLDVLYLNADKSIYHKRGVQRPKQYKDKFLVVYFGSALPLQGMDVIMNAAGLCLEDEQIQFILIGPVNKRYEKLNYSNIMYIDWLEQRKLSDYIEMADLCLAGHFNDKIEKAKRTIPGKAYIYEAMEKPMILGNGPANHERYQEEQEGIFFVPMGDSQALADKIKEIKYHANHSYKSTL